MSTKHRLEALKLADYDAVECVVIDGTFEEAEWAAIGANRTHGLRRSTKDKQNAVKRALANPQSKLKTTRELAEHCGVSHTTIERWQARLWHNVPDEPQDEGETETDDDEPAYDEPDTRFEVVEDEEEEPESARTTSVAEKRTRETARTAVSARPPILWPSAITGPLRGF